MRFSGAMVRIALSLVLALSVFSGAVAQADGQAPTPPTATSVALNTYGSLPVVVLNLTQSPINMNLFTNSNSSNYGSSLPVAAGLPGVYYANGGETTTLSNITTPTVNPGGMTNTSTSSLHPAASTNPTTNAITFNNDYGWMSLFTVFPSWTQAGTYNFVQYVTLDNIKNQGAAADSYDVVSGYPDGNGKNATQNGHYTTAAALNAGQATTTTLKLWLLNSANGSVQTAYNININSLGGGTSGSVSIANSGFSILKVLHTALNVVTDIATCASGDPLGIIDFVAGIPGTISDICTDISNNSSSTNVNITTNTAYPAKSKGINVTATADPTYSSPLTAYAGDSQSLMYEVQPAANQQLPLVQQNAVFVTTWRQSPPDNYGITLPNGADALFVVVVNQGVYAATQMQQCVNNSAPAQMAGGARYQPTQAQAQDSAKLLQILTAISQKNPQDAKAIVDLFGIHGKYDQIKNNPAELQQLKAQAKTILEKHSKDLPAVEQYLTKLAQK